MNILKNEQGYMTIMEWMIIIAIVGILAAITIPNYISYKEKKEAEEKGIDLYVTAVKKSNTHKIDAHHFEYNGHKYIVFNRCQGTLGVHDPDCPCWEERLKEIVVKHEPSIPITTIPNLQETEDWRGRY